MSVEFIRGFDRTLWRHFLKEVLRNFLDSDRSSGPACSRHARDGNQPVCTASVPVAGRYGRSGPECGAMVGILYANGISRRAGLCSAQRSSVHRDCA